MVKINWTTQAIQDIHEIREYYRRLSKKYSDQFTDQVFNKVDILTKFPLIGRIVPEYESSEIRELIFKNYRIIYIVGSPEVIDILAVHNGLKPLSEDSIFE